MASNLVRPLRAHALVLAIAALLGACGGGGGGGEANTLPERAFARSIAFDNAESDVSAVLLPAQAGDPTLVMLRDTATGRIARQVFVLDDGTVAQAVPDADGRLGELVIGDHRFVFTDYTATHVTVAYHAPDGSVSTEQVERAASATATAATQARRTTLAAEGARAGAHDDANPTLDEMVDEALEWVADPSNTFLPLMIYRKAGEAVGGLFDKIRGGVERLKEKAQKIETVVSNKLQCGSTAPADCGQTVAERAPGLIQQIAEVDPSASTTAGFDVTADGITPRRDEWDPLINKKQISTEFTMTEVPCAESVFADMNPACPQYVAPKPTEPAEPTTPTTPTTPTDPTNPGTPTDPTNPGTPTTPTEPSNPSQPGTPSEPTTPTSPGTPTTPTNPSDGGGSSATLTRNASCTQWFNALAAQGTWRLAHVRQGSRDGPPAKDVTLKFIAPKSYVLTNSEAIGLVNGTGTFVLDDKFGGTYCRFYFDNGVTHVMFPESLSGGQFRAHLSPSPTSSEYWLFTPA